MPRTTDCKFNGTDKEVSIGHTDPVDPEQELPHLSTVRGRIISVGFEPGSSFVRISDSGKKNLRYLASSEQVDLALTLRSRDVVVKAVEQGRKSRLLHLWAADHDPESLGEEQRSRLLFDKWDELLRRLAQ